MIVDLRSWRPSTFGMLFMLLVGVILASVPGWRAVYFVWMVPSGIILAVLALSTLGAGLAHAVRCEWRVLRLDVIQLSILVLGMAALPALLHLSDWVERLES
ncbi:MAG: hypothetical protein ABIO42_07710 [Burkholderiaceae bacterium]